MKNTIKIIIAGSNYLINAGLECLIKENAKLELTAKVSSAEELLRVIPSVNADVLLLDLTTIDYSIDFINSIKKADEYMQILVFNNYMPRQFISKVLENGVVSYLMLCCDKEEITEAILKTTQGERFLCGHIVEELLASGKSKVLPQNSLYCGGLTITEREMEVIKLIAGGLSTQEIADKLFLSAYTVSTHRKNIMNKLGLTNTASLVMYAVKEQIVPLN